MREKERGPPPHEETRASDTCQISTADSSKASAGCGDKQCFPRLGARDSGCETLVGARARIQVVLRQHLLELPSFWAAVSAYREWERKTFRHSKDEEKLES